jgi:NADH dehydrogenase FAD-containing subunit
MRAPDSHIPPQQRNATWASARKDMVGSALQEARPQPDGRILGRFSAVVQLTRPTLRWHDFIAWLAWLLHLMSLVGFRNRLLALLDWSVDYLRRDTANRVSMSERDGV